MAARKKATKANPRYLDRWLIEQLMFGTGRVRRFTQDSPVLPDVWLEYALDPEVLPNRLTRPVNVDDPHPPVNLLLTPFREKPVGGIRNEVSRRVLAARKHPALRPFKHGDRPTMRIIYNQSTVAATLYFEELVRAVIPMTDWWRKLTKDFDVKRLQEPNVQAALAEALEDPEHPPTEGLVRHIQPDVLWLIRIVGTIALVHRGSALPKSFLDKTKGPGKATTSEWRRVVDGVADLLKDVEPQNESYLIYSIALNRVATPSIVNSRRAVKADATENVFNVSCKSIRWAIIDSGIDATHPGLRRKAKETEEKPKSGKPFDGYKSRVRATYDFSQISHLLDPDALERRLKAIKGSKKGKTEEPSQEQRHLEQVHDALLSGRTVDWGVLGPLLEIKHDPKYTSPRLDHGTHVAGILAANWSAGDSNGAIEEDIRGICPEIELYDLRILDENNNGDEFTVMAALQFVRWLNSSGDHMAIHGVNMSLSIPHDVANYACGRTPVCEEAERVVSSGVVVVVAAGNQGYRKYATPDGLATEAYNTISITDPGNADLVITVGATHRARPHTYGVSYFSSRGPTGDGRLKPDLVAPGEKILSLLPGEASGVKDGTSMAAPHVSGAAALLMARHDELIGRPVQIKQILREAATDLGRERYFQGAGMLDILRALQSV